LQLEGHLVDLMVEWLENLMDYQMEMKWVGQKEARMAQKWVVLLDYS